MKGSHAVCLFAVLFDVKAGYVATQSRGDRICSHSKFSLYNFTRNLLETTVVVCDGCIKTLSTDLSCNNPSVVVARF